MPFTIADGAGGSLAATYARTTKGGVGFYSFTVNPVPEPAILAALGLGAAALIRRRHAC